MSHKKGVVEMSDKMEWMELPPELFVVRNNPKESVNAEYVADIEQYTKNPVLPCSKTEALKHLKRFARKDFRDFWRASVNEYLPAVSEGTMKLHETVYTHDEAISYAKNLISTLQVKELAKDFLYGVAHNAPEYRTALACYYYIKNLPVHEFEKKFIGTTAKGDHYSDHTCEICGYNSKLSDEPKMQFWHINVDMEHFYFKALIPFRFYLNTAIVFLEEYKTLPCPACSPADYAHFKKIISVIENAPENTTSGKLCKELKQSGLLTMTMAQIEAFVDMLGYLNILHTDDSFGVTIGHTCERDMLYPLSDRGYAAHPVNRWTRKCGIDYDSISMLFDGI